MNKPLADDWYDNFEEITNEGRDRMLQIDGYKVLTTIKFRNRFKRDQIYLTLSPADCTDVNCSVFYDGIGADLKNGRTTNLNWPETIPYFASALRKEESQH